MNDEEISCWVWSKLSSRKWEDAWNERLAWCPQFSIEYFGQKKEKIRIQAFLESKEEINVLQKMFGGSIRCVKTQDWVSKQEVSSKLIKIKDKFIITQKEDAEHLTELRLKYPNRDILSFPPRLAFGTGDHQTTATCLRNLCDVVPRLRKGWDMYDLGTGTGILAIAARYLGASAVWACDWDEQAIQSAAGYIEHHQITGIELAQQDVLKWSPVKQVPLIAANLFSTILIGAAANISQALESQGYLISSGILQEQWPEVQQAFEATGLILLDKHEIENQPWVSVVMQKR